MQPTTPIQIERYEYTNACHLVSGVDGEENGRDHSWSMQTMLFPHIFQQSGSTQHPLCPKHWLGTGTLSALELLLGEALFFPFSFSLF